MPIMRFSNPNTNAVIEDYGFEDTKRLMFDAGVNSLKGVSPKKADGKIREIFQNILGVNENSSARELRNAIRRNAISVYEVIEEVVPQLMRVGWAENPFFDAFVEYRNGALGDTNEFYVEDDTILSVAKLSGGHHDIIRQRLGEGSSFSVKTNWYGVKIYTEFELFMTGRIDWASFVQKIYDAYDRMMNDMLYKATIDAAAAVTPASTFTATGKLDTTTVDHLIEVVENVEMATQEQATIVGTKVALSKLSKIVPAEWISNEMKQERHQTGALGLWEGIPLLEIKQGFKDRTYTTKVAKDDVLLIIPSGDNKFIKVFDEGDAQIYQVQDSATNMDMTMTYEYQQKMGIATVMNTKIGSYTITA